MRVLIISLFGFLAACNGSTNTVQQVPYTDQAVTAKIQALTEALAASTHEDAKKFSELTLVGKTKTVTGLRMQAEFNALATGISFGPCSNMGVLIGFTNSNGDPADALSAVGQDFKQCTGYLYSVFITDGTLFNANRLFWDGPCVNNIPTGNPIEWEASGAGYNTASLQNGVVFSSPVDGSKLMVQAGQTPQPTQIQSVWVTSNPGCQSDVETQLMYSVTPNDVSISGVPDNGVGKFQLGTP